ncbi:MAG: hypothetical protein ACREQ3_19930, partial [Candidatus Binatia bacterium]
MSISIALTPTLSRKAGEGEKWLGKKLESLPVLFAAAILLLAAHGWCDEPGDGHKEFRVCADPNNLPFSNQKQEGFENKIAELLARTLGSRVTYTWWPQRRGFIRNTLSAGQCDVVIGVPAGYDPVLTTQPYYRSTYVFV